MTSLEKFEILARAFTRFLASGSASASQILPVISNMNATSRMVSLQPRKIYLFNSEGYPLDLSFRFYLSFFGAHKIFLSYLRITEETQL